MVQMTTTMRATVALLLLQGCGSSDTNNPSTADAAGADGGVGGSPGASPEGGGAADPFSQAPQTGDAPNIDEGPQVSAEGELDYSDPAMWLCRPGLQWNWCLIDQDATELLPDGTRRVEDHEPAARPDFDCFYVYPTVAQGSTPNDLDFAPAAKLDPLLSQAARLSSMCRVFAPQYRQLTLSSIGGMGSGDAALAVGDVLDAFDYYMENDNAGRPFVLLGHSQGSGMLTAVLNDRFEGNADLQGQLISALLVGSNVSVPTGEVTGGTFATIPICTEMGQTGCVVSWATYADDNPPSAGALFGEDPPGETSVCTSPQELAGNTGKLEASYFPLSLNNTLFEGEVSEIRAAAETEPFETDFIVYRDAFRASCVTRDGFTFFEATLELPADDMRPAPPWRNPTVEAAGFGLHIVDWNLAMGDAMDMIRIQAEAALGR